MSLQDCSPPASSMQIYLNNSDFSVLTEGQQMDFKWTLWVTPFFFLHCYLNLVFFIFYAFSQPKCIDQ